MNRRVLGVVLAAAILIAVAIAVQPHYKRPPAPVGKSTGPEPIGLRTNMTDDGNWLLEIFGGYCPIKQSRLTISNASTGESIFDVKLSDITPVKNHPNAVLTDNDANGHLDAGDSIILKSFPNIEGYRVEFIVKEDIIVGSFKLSS